jgi:hypothetical protein
MLRPDPNLLRSRRRGMGEGAAKRTFWETIMRSCQPTRRDALQTIARSAVAFVTVSVTARSLGLSASAQIPEKILIGSLPIPLITSFIGQVDFFKDEGLTIEVTRFNNFAPILQAMTAGSVVAGEIGVAPSIIGLTRGLPFIAPFLGGFSTPSHPFERIMVMENSPIKVLEDLKGKKLAFLGPGTVPDMFLGALPKDRGSARRTLSSCRCPHRTCRMRWRKGWSMRSSRFRRPIWLRNRNTRLAPSPTRPNWCPMGRLMAKMIAGQAHRGNLLNDEFLEVDPDRATAGAAF